MKKSEIAPIRILIVDDDENVQMVLKKGLSKLGHHISLETTAEAALAALQRSHFHVVITDIQMSEMSGVELLQEIKSLNPLIQVYIITAHSNLEYVIQCMKGGAYDYFEKPLKLEAIAETLTEAARRVTRWNQLYKKYSSS